MTEKDVMIRDWVHIDGRGRVPAHNDQVRMIFEDYCDTGNSFIGWEYVEPIPLIEDILKANGFKWRLGLWYTGELDSLGQEFIFNTCYEGYPYIHESYGCIIWHVKYVHELQHALRLCGLNKLADNFKIKAMEE